MRPVSRLVVLTSFAAVGAALVSLSFQAAEPSSEPLADTVCLDCHEDVAHAMLGSAHDPGTPEVSCLRCHAGAATEAHVDDPDVLPVNPAHLSADSMTTVCTDCHADPHALNLFERDPHRDGGLACAACHKVHDNDRVGLLADDEPALCFSCHQAQKGDFTMPTHHPVNEGVVRCSDCHLSVAQSSKQHVPSGPSETCTQCHAAFEGPYPFQHAATVDYSTEEGGCLNCHAPHGSANPRLLKQPYQSPDYALCSQCHSVPKHENNINHGTQFAGVPCTDCHIDVHGSYDNRNLLDPSLVAQGCFAVGCHTY